MKRVSKKKYKHHLATYPQGFHGIVVRDDNFCLQFGPIDLQTRLGIVDGSPNTNGLKKILHGLELGIPTHETIELQTIGVRCYFPVLHKLQFQLLEAYDKYLATHMDDKQFKDELLRLKVKLDNMLVKHRV